VPVGGGSATPLSQWVAETNWWFRPPFWAQWGWLGHSLAPWLHQFFFFDFFLNKIENKLHGTWQDLISPCVIFVKLTNSQQIEGPIWSFIKTTGTSCDKNQTLKEKKL
jgi:hypothetical protein